VSIIRPILNLSFPARPDLDLPSGGLVADLVPGADPARQDLSAGTASATVTFNAPTGGSGAGVTNGVALSKPVGSPAALSGSGLGPYTVSNMLSGEAYVLLYTATDIGDGQLANNFALVDVGGGGSSNAAIFPNSRMVQRPVSLVFENGFYVIVT
jgi:hypothetical protein